MAIIKFAILWIFVGMLVNHICGMILMKKMARIFSETEKETQERVARTNEEAGLDSGATVGELIWNDITWPSSVYHAIKGFQRITDAQKDDIHGKE